MIYHCNSCHRTTFETVCPRCNPGVVASTVQAGEQRYPQYLLMVALWPKDDQIVKDLGATLFLDSSTLTPLIKRLEVAGFVSRKRDAQDERQVRISLTEQGKVLKARSLHVPDCIEAAVGMKAQDVQDIQAAVADIRTRLLKLRTP